MVLANKARRWLKSLGGEPTWGYKSRISRETGIPTDQLKKILDGKHGLSLTKLDRIARHRSCKAWEILREIEHGVEGNQLKAVGSTGGSILPFNRGVQIWRKLREIDPRVAEDALELFEIMMKLDMMAVFNVICLEVFEQGPRYAIPTVNEYLLLEEERCTTERTRKRRRLFSGYRPRHQGTACPRRLYRDQKEGR